MKKDKEWLKGLINEEGTVMDMNSLGRHDGQYWKNENIKINKGRLFYLIDQLDEPEKPVIPQFVASYIELNKGWSEDRQEYIEDDNSGLWFALNGDSHGMPNSVSDWLFNEENVETFAKAWIYGYEVEKEQLYAVKVPNADSYYYGKFESGRVYIGSAEPKRIKDIEWYHFTKKDALTKLPDVPKKQWIKLDDL